MSKYYNLIFDLDNTLWNFTKNSKESLYDIFQEYELNKQYNSFDDFLSIYHKHNEPLWDKYRKSEITKEILRMKRFELTLKDGGIDDKKLIKQIALGYLDKTTTKSALFPNAIEVLEILHKNYRLHIITNGFEEVQFHKMERSKLTPFFETITTSEEAGVLKPNPGIFKHALHKIDAAADTCLMIGDDLLSDIQGARNAGIDQVFFNPAKIKHNQVVTYEINKLPQLLQVLKVNGNKSL